MIDYLHVTCKPIPLITLKKTLLCFLSPRTFVLIIYSSFFGKLIFCFWKWKLLSHFIYICFYFYTSLICWISGSGKFQEFPTLSYKNCASLDQILYKSKLKREKVTLDISSLGTKRIAKNQLLLAIRKSTKICFLMGNKTTGYFTCLCHLISPKIWRNE